MAAANYGSRRKGMALMGMVKDTILDYAEHLAAENWAGLKRLQKRYGFNNLQHLDTMLTGAALCYAQFQEPTRSANFNALIKLLELLDDERLADAQQERYRERG